MTSGKARPLVESRARDFEVTEENEKVRTENAEQAYQVEPQEGARRVPSDRGVTEAPRASALEVTVDHNIEKAMKILKRKLIKEGVFKELKLRRYYEKPSEKRKRKLKESLKKLRKEESRAKKNSLL